MSQKFSLGSVVMTVGAQENITPQEIMEALNRHKCGDWSIIPEGDKRENEIAIKCGYRILSSYRAINGTKFWIITEADRSATTILLPEEY